MKIVIAIDKFKGSASSVQLAQYIKDAILSYKADAKIVVVPIADGGDGTMVALKQLFQHDDVTPLSVNVPGPLKNLPQVKANYFIHHPSSTAYMDLATTSGLALVPKEQRDVMKTSTLGTGKMISNAIANGARHIVMGLGGSATCDGAMGILAALGCQFYDNSQHVLTPCGENLRHIASIDTSALASLVADVKFSLLVDVDNPLYGSRGAAAVFAPQKGASPQQVEVLDQGLKNFARFMPQGIDNMPGAGAAGGVAAGMAAFLGATLRQGIDFMLEVAHFDDVLDNAQLVITGEGRIDEQTAMGKAPMGVLKAARKRNIPVVALCGSMAPNVTASQLGFNKVIAVTPPSMPLQQAMKLDVTLENVRTAVLQLMANGDY